MERLAAIGGIDHVQVAAPPGCEATARRFYGELLGLEELAKPAALRGRGGVWFRCGAQQLHVGVEEPFAPARRAHPALLAADAQALEALAARLRSAGVAIDDDESLPGVRRFYAHDPFGNRLEVMAAPRQEAGAQERTPAVQAPAAR
jgi:catechol 2,3-dioxygenase-like lactoylglutathione lyase family enzyme